VACGSRTNPKNKEHPFPQWLITRTKTDRTSIRWIPGNRIPADEATLPLCRQCNRDFGDQLEAPMSRILDDIEADRGLSDNEAELIVRWLWKIEGLLWHVSHPTHDYSSKYTLRERVLRPLDAIRASSFLLWRCVRALILLMAMLQWDSIPMATSTVYSSPAFSRVLR
jgi:hypothetical protein